MVVACMCRGVRRKQRRSLQGCRVRRIAAEKVRSRGAILKTSEKYGLYPTKRSVHENGAPFQSRLLFSRFQSLPSQWIALYSGNGVKEREDDLDRKMVDQRMLCAETTRGRQLRKAKKSSVFKILSETEKNVICVGFSVWLEFFLTMYVYVPISYSCYCLPLSSPSE